MSVSGKARFGYERSAKHVGIFRMLAEPFFCIAAGGDGFAARFAQRAGDAFHHLCGNTLPAQRFVDEGVVNVYNARREFLFV